LRRSRFPCSQQERYRLTIKGSLDAHSSNEQFRLLAGLLLVVADVDRNGFENAPRSRSRDIASVVANEIAKHTRTKPMKIVCESCGAKYSISDDRVVGKMFKIRCKKCSEVIVVRGDQPHAAEAQAPEASAAGASAQTAIWHIVVDGEQAGPYTPAQLADMLTSGSVDWEAYVWSEGFDNWLPMRDVPDLVAQITGQPVQQAAPAAPASYRSQQATLTGQPSMGADPFAEDSAGSDSGMFGAQNASADLFARNPGQAAAAAFGGADDPGVVSSSPSPRLSTERVLTGARNENSELFSLKNLQSLATSATPSAPPFGGGGASAGGERGGFAGGEGSGLIDIRALASTTGIGESTPGNKDELLSIGSQGGAFGTLGSPMLTARADEGDANKKTLIWASVAGLGVLCIAGVAVAWLLRPAAAPAAAASVGVAPAVAPAAAAPAPAPAAAAPAAASAAAAPSEGELAAKAAAEQAAKDDDNESGHSSGSSEHRRKHESSGATKAAAEPSEPEPKKAAPAKPSGPRSIDDLLDGALSGNSSGGKSAKSEAAAAADSNLPAQPSRDQVMSAMNAVKSAVSACAKGETGIATVNVSVAGSTGRVTTAQVNGVTGPAGSCIAQAVRKAQFPKFKQSVFKVAFPYKL
jgi:predicted Zn finger-like uncharacterized protein